MQAPAVHSSGPLQRATPAGSTVRVHWSGSRGLEWTAGVDKAAGSKAAGNKAVRSKAVRSRRRPRAPRSEPERGVPGRRARSRLSRPIHSSQRLGFVPTGGGPGRRTGAGPVGLGLDGSCPGGVAEAAGYGARGPPPRSSSRSRRSPKPGVEPKTVVGSEDHCNLAANCLPL